MRKNKPKEEMTFQERVEKFEKYYDAPEQHYKIFSELGFSYVDDDCDGFAPAGNKKISVKPPLKSDGTTLTVKNTTDHKRRENEAGFKF